MTRRTIVALVMGTAAVCAAVVCVGLPGQAPPQPVPAKINPAPLCSDFRVTLEMQKSSSGLVRLTANVCNGGPGAYANPAGALDGYFMVYTWHPPKTPAQEANLKFYAHTDLGTKMQPKECKTFHYRYQIENFSRWGTFPPSRLERQAMKQFVARVEKKGPSGFTSCEDTDISNATASVDVPYMEKTK